MTDGANRTNTTTYDSRLRPLTYQIGVGVVHQSYEYYNDSSMRFVHNVSDSNFDRLYEYDQAGRLALATTGGAARGDLGAIPYHETFGYNAWGDTTSRFTETWSQNEFADAGSFTNGRRDGWGYEADGNIKTIDTRTYDYDAVGNRVLMTGQLWSGSNYFPSSTTNAYDGDGRRVEEVLNWPSTFMTRYLRSSVLGGAIAQEINSAGQTISYVYLPDGTQLSTLIGFPKWRHETPAGTGLYENYQSGFVNRVEFDPVRANVGLTAPPPPDTNGGDGDIGGNHNGGPTDSRYSDMANPAAGCYDIGGAVLPCTWSIFDVFDKFVWTPARNPAKSAPPDSPATWVPPKRVVPINIPNPFDKYVDVPVERVDTTYSPGYWSYAAAPSVNITIGRRSTAQDTITERPFSEADLNAIRAKIAEMAAIGRCGMFLSRLLANAGAGDDPPVETNIVDLFDRVSSQGGFVSATLNSKGASRGYSSVRGAAGAPGGAKVLLSSTSDVYSPKTRISYYAYDAISELTHVAGTQVSNYAQGAFSDFNLANEALHLANDMGTAVQNLKLTPPNVNPYEDPNGKWSDFYHGIVKLYCKRTERP